jgi:multiple sugar transport system ATP-binding protein
MAQVLLRHVYKTYAGTVEAVKDLNLECRDKEFLCLLGPSGCGKTSTLRMIAGLERVTRGDILIGERRVNDVPPRDRDIAMIFENYALYPHLTVYDNIAMPLKARKFPKAEIDARVRQAAEVLDMVDLLPHRTTQLSGGQKQRVGIGRAIVRRPSLFLMDEPISHLEAQLRAQMRAELKRLHKQAEATTIYVTHDQLEAMALADRIAVMHLGLLQQVATPQELFDQPANEFVAGFIGSPPMNFADGRLIADDGSLRLLGEGLDLALPPKMANVLRQRTAPESLRLGIRPIDLNLAFERRGPAAVPGQVYAWEPLGDSALAHVTIGPAQFIVQADPGRPAEPGTAAWVEFTLDRVHLFDPQTGQNLLA